MSLQVRKIRPLLPPSALPRRPGGGGFVINFQQAPSRQLEAEGNLNFQVELQFLAPG
jgi:hypothetical protein